MCATHMGKAQPACVYNGSDRAHNSNYCGGAHPLAGLDGRTRRALDDHDAAVEVPYVHRGRAQRLLQRNRVACQQQVVSRALPVVILVFPLPEKEDDVSRLEARL